MVRINRDSRFIRTMIILIALEKSYLFVVGQLYGKASVPWLVEGLDSRFGGGCIQISPKLGFVDDDRHPVMDFLHFLIGLGGQYHEPVLIPAVFIPVFSV